MILKRMKKCASFRGYVTFLILVLKKYKMDRINCSWILTGKERRIENE